MFEMDKDFKKWLTENKYGNYNGVEITPTSKLVRYTFVVSLVVITHRSESRYYFEDMEKSKASMAKLFSTLGSLLFGWRGIPWGPIWTIKAVIDNMANSDEIIWGSLAGEQLTEEQKNAIRESNRKDELGYGSSAYKEEQMKQQKENSKEQLKKKRKDIIIYIIIAIIALVIFLIAGITGNMDSWQLDSI